MGLLSGGQILSKKRQFFGSDDGKVKGTAVTTFEGMYIVNYDYTTIWKKKYSALQILSLLSETSISQYHLRFWNPLGQFGCLWKF